jgi:D-threo-aldose 1-dehydrogenase
MAALLEGHGRSLLSAALQFPLTSSAVLSVAAGMATPRQARENVAALAARVPDEVWAELDGTD